MKCNITSVPGYADTSKIKNPGLEMKLEKELSIMDKVFISANQPEGVDAMEAGGFKEVSFIYISDYKGKRHYVPTKKVVLYHGTPAAELEGGVFDIERSGNQGSGWLSGTHATPNINIANRYYKDGGSVYRVGYNIKKMWHLTGDNKISNKMLDDYTKITEKRATHPTEAAVAVESFKNRGKMDMLPVKEQHTFLLKHGYNLVLDGSSQVVMLDPVNNGTQPMRLDDKEIKRAEKRRKKPNKSLEAFYKLDDNRKGSIRRRRSIDEEYREKRFIREMEYMLR